eukprot:TRINITY_DN847_c1_g1_i3.p1 TRINITY_DN847_c1_g1~~TRINITY_DN847_c1_g1_i3.p1  ORF type:complete len:1420 (+),score=353.56 TRINITY_DN847_c1_g1_i3:73-4332(+)
MTKCDMCADPLLSSERFACGLDNVSEATLGGVELEALLASSCDGYLDSDMLVYLQHVFDTHKLIAPLDCLQKNERDRCSVAMYLLPKTMAAMTVQDWLSEQAWLSKSNLDVLINLLNSQYIWDIPSLITTLNAGLLIKSGVHADLAECVFKSLWRDMSVELRGLDVPLFTVVDPDADDITQLHVMFVDREEVPPGMFFGKHRVLKTGPTNLNKARISMVEQRVKKTETLRQELIREEEKAENPVETAIKTQKPKKAKATDLADAKLRANKAAAYKLIQKKDEEVKRQKRREDKKAKETAAKVAATSLYDEAYDSDAREKAAERAKRELLMEEENKEKEEKEREKKAAKRQAQRERRAAEKELLRQKEEQEKKAEAEAKQLQKDQAAAERQRRQGLERVRKEEVRERDSVISLETETRDKHISAFNSALRKREAERRKLIDNLVKDEKAKRVEQSKSESGERHILDEFRKKLLSIQRNIEKTITDERSKRDSVIALEKKEWGGAMAKKIQDEKQKIEKILEDERNLEEAKTLWNSRQQDESYAKQRVFPYGGMKQENTTVPLIRAAGKGQADEVRRLIDGGMNANKSDAKGWTPLIAACLNGQQVVAKLCLQNGANPNHKTNAGETALHAASVNGHLTCVRYVVEAGGNVNCLTEEVFSPLTFASQNGHLEVCRYLIQKGANVHAKTSGNWTPLMAAALNGHLPVAKLILSQGGVDTSVRSESGWTAFMAACRNGQKETAETIYKHGGCSVNARNYCGETAMICASKAGHDQLVSWLLSVKGDPNIQNDDGWTALIFAAKNGYRDTVSQLLANGADPNIKNSKGWTAVAAASFHGKSEVIPILAKNGADVNLTANRDWSPLMFAAKGGHHSTCLALLQEGADINAENGKGWTALMIGVKGGFTHVVKVLCDWDESEERVDINRRSHLNSGSTSALILCAVEGNLASLQILVETAAKHDIRLKYGNETLFAACRVGYLDIVRFLLECKVSVDARDERGNTPLFYACKYGNLEMIRFLRDCGADCGTINNDGLDPYSFAISGSKKPGQADLLARTLNCHPQRIPLGTRKYSFAEDNPDPRNSTSPPVQYDTGGDQWGYADPSQDYVPGYHAGGPDMDPQWYPQSHSAQEPGEGWTGWGDDPTVPQNPPFRQPSPPPPPAPPAPAAPKQPAATRQSSSDILETAELQSLLEKCRESNPSATVLINSMLRSREKFEEEQRELSAALRSVLNITPVAAASVPQKQAPPPVIAPSVGFGMEQKGFTPGTNVGDIFKKVAETGSATIAAPQPTQNTQPYFKTEPKPSPIIPTPSSSSGVPSPSDKYQMAKLADEWMRDLVSDSSELSKGGEGIGIGKIGDPIPEQIGPIGAPIGFNRIAEPEVDQVGFEGIADEGNNWLAEFAQSEAANPFDTSDLFSNAWAGDLKN